MARSGRGGDAHHRGGDPVGRPCGAARRRIGLAAGFALASIAPAMSAGANGPSCDQPTRALAAACSDPTIAADVDALRVAYEIAGPRSHGGDAAWRREMQSCGDDRKCLGASIAERQRSVNMARLEPPPGVERHRARSVEPYRPTAPEPARPAMDEPVRIAPRTAEQAPEVAQTAPTWYYPPSPASAQPASAGGWRASTGSPAASAKDTGTGMAGRVAIALLVALGATAALAFALLHGRGERAPGPRCPRCHRRSLVLEAVHDVHAPFLRRRGPGRRAHEVAADRVRRVCPCGYASDGGTRPPTG